MLAKAESSANAVMESSVRMSNALRAMIEEGHNDHVAFACEIQMRMYFNALVKAKGERYARSLAGRLAFRGDDTGQSDYSPVNFPTMG